MVAVGGSTLAIAGNGLDLASAAEVFLSVPGNDDGMERDNAWRQDTEPGELDLALPTGYADPVTSCRRHPPRRQRRDFTYLTVWRSGSTRSNPIPLVIAPRVDGVDRPAGADAGCGWPLCDHRRRVRSQPCDDAEDWFGFARTTAPQPHPAPAEFTVNATGTGDQLQTAELRAGAYPVLLAVNGFAASTGWVVVTN